MSLFAVISAAITVLFAGGIGKLIVYRAKATRIVAEAEILKQSSTDERYAKLIDKIEARLTSAEAREMACQANLSELNKNYAKTLIAVERAEARARDAQAEAARLTKRLAGLENSQAELIQKTDETADLARQFGVK